MGNFISSIVSLIFILFALLGFIWLFFGGIFGVIFFLKMISEKDETKRKKYLKRFLISILGGFIILFFTIIPYTIVRLVEAYFNICIVSCPEIFPEPKL